MTTVVHGTKDALDQMIELTSALFTRIQRMPPSDERDAFYEEIRKIREIATSRRGTIDNLEKQNAAARRAAE